MCIILDANAFSDYLNETDDMEPVRRWLEGGQNMTPKGKLVYSPTLAIKQEINRHKRFRRRVRTLRRTNRIKEVSVAQVIEKQTTLGKIKSDDPHILALALAGKVSLLVSNDKNLGDDFKRLTREFGRGKVYKDASHKHLLTEDLCP